MTRTRPASSRTSPMRSAIAGVVVPSNERISIVSLGPTAPSALAAEERAHATLGRPLLSGAEVVDVAEGDVAHRRAIRDREREREERDPALGVDGAVDRVDDDPPLARPRRNTLPELFRDEHEVLAARRASRSTTASSAAWSIAVVSSPPWPSRSTGSRSTRVGSRSRTSRMSATQSRHVSSQAVTARPDGRGGRRAAWGRSTCSSGACARPRRATEKTSSTRGARSEERDVRSALSTESDGLVRAWRVPDPVEPVAVDELDVELSVRARERARRCPRRYAIAAERESGSSASRASASSRSATCSPSRRSTRSGRSRRRDESGRRVVPDRRSRRREP